MTQHSGTGGIHSRRDVLRGMSVAGTGAVGVAAASERGEAGAITGDCAVADWPDPISKRIDLDGDTPEESGGLPNGGDLVIYVHGLFGEDVISSIDEFNGLNQATALREALRDEGVDTPVVAGMWDSTTLWWTAKRRADSAGETLADWLENNRDSYESVVIVGHSLGGRVTLAALSELAARGGETTITSAALLGAGVDPDTVCNEYDAGIETSVEEGVYSYHSEGDNVVCLIYAIAEWTSGLGCRGSDCSALPEGFVDVDMTGTVDGHCNFLKPASMSYDGGSAVPEMVTRQFEFATNPTRTVSGTVTGDGEALADATVTVETNGETVSAVTTDESGQYALELEPGSYTVVTEAVGFESEATALSISSDTTLDISLTPEEPEPELVTVTGTVTHDGTPLGDVIVGLRDAETDDALLYTDTDSNGQYEIAVSLDTTEPVDVELHAIGPEAYEPTVETFTITGGEIRTHPVELTLEPGSLNGHVTENGQPLTGVTVEIIDIRTGELVAETVTDADGQYEYSVEPGEYGVRVRHENREATSETETVSTDTTTTLDVDFTGVPAPLEPERQPLDLNGDGLYRDVRGDNEFTIADVQMLFAHLDDPAVQNYATAYNFSGFNENQVSIFDVQALYNDLQRRDELGLE